MSEEKDSIDYGRNHGRIGRAGVVTRISHLRRARAAVRSGAEPCECQACGEGLEGISQSFAERRPTREADLASSDRTNEEETTTPPRTDNVAEYR